MTADTSSDGTRPASLMATVLALDLVELAEELATSSIGLPAAATMVQRDLKLAVRSFLALTLTVDFATAPPVTLTLAAGPVFPRDVGSAFSLRLDRGSTARLTLTCYAGRPGVLTELASDLAVSLKLPDSAVNLQPSIPAELTPGLRGLDLFRAAHERHGVQRATG